MAYRNLISQACANRAEVFKRFRDFVCRRNGSYDYSTTGIGWTLHDSNYAVDQNNIRTNDWFVIYSPGESGGDDLYFRCTYLTNYIKIEGFLNWNASTNAGVQQYNTASNWSIADADVPILWIYGDLDSIFGISRQKSGSSNYYPVAFGKATNTKYSQATVTCSGALSAGSGVTINVGTVPASWQAGDKVFIRDQDRIDLITISSKTASAIVADLANSYAAGAKLCADLGYHCALGTYLAYGCIVLIDHAGNKSQNMNGWSNDGTIHSTNYPDPLNSEHFVVPIYLSSATNGYIGELKNVWQRHTSGLTAGNAYADRDGNQYRAFALVGGNYVVKEV